MAAPIKLLALSPMPEEGAGCRFRIAQFIPYLQTHGFDVTLRTLFTPEFFRLVYQPGRYVRKTTGFARLSLDHLLSLRDISQYDVVFMYREIFPIGPALVERFLAAGNRPPIVFDFDDAIFLPNVSDANRLIRVLKMPGKVGSIIQRSAHVVAGNEFLASYARHYNDVVTVIPTSVDTTKFVPRSPGASDRRGGALVIGWIGSPTTATYIAGLDRALRRVRERHSFRLRVSGASSSVTMKGIDVENVPWTLDDEVRLFNTCDIGVYPLADDEWSRGKCGFKAIQFMACGVPVVASAVGVNREIIQDGVNGFLAATETEWVEKIQRLIDDPELRQRMAEAGRQTIERSYSLQVHAPKLALTLRHVVERSRCRRLAAAATVP
ncbi:MAG: glycosyl transferase family 1 [Acidobacteria bacterium]|nr:MAG: glycosyl transferase family 1 [Acidobacteriota bacterium]